MVTSWVLYYYCVLGNMLLISQRTHHCYHNPHTCRHTKKLHSSSSCFQLRSRSKVTEVAWKEKNRVREMPLLSALWLPKREAERDIPGRGGCGADRGAFVPAAHPHGKCSLCALPRTMDAYWWELSFRNFISCVWVLKMRPCPSSQQ